MIPVVLGALGALAIGLSLGLLGSGGSIVTVPVLVYLVGQEEKTAIAGSLFIVGSIALGGGALYAWKRAVDWRSVLFFGLPGMAGTWGGAWLSRFVSGPLQLSVFAAVALLAAELRRPEPGHPHPAESPAPNLRRLPRRRGDLHPLAEPARGDLVGRSRKIGARSPLGSGSPAPPPHPNHLSTVRPQERVSR